MNRVWRYRAKQVQPTLDQVVAALPPQTLAAVNAWFAEFARKGEAFRWKMRAKRKDGKKK